MRFYTFILSVILFVGCSGKSGSSSDSAQSSQPQQAVTTMEWLTEMQYNFGSFSELDTMYADFLFRNTGQKPLVLHEVQTFCGCTKASYDKKPTLPGDTGIIHVVFNSNGILPGRFHKHIRVHSNATDSVTELSITGFYEE
jgi:hypothetical protein